MLEINDLKDKFNQIQSENHKLVAANEALKFDCDGLESSNRRIDSEVEINRQRKFSKFRVWILFWFSI